MPPKGKKSKKKEAEKDDDDDGNDNESAKSSSYVKEDLDEDEEEVYEEEEADDPTVKEFSIEVSGNYELGDTGSFTVSALDERGDVFTGDFDASVDFSDDNNNVEISERGIDQDDFKSGVYTGSFEAVDDGSEKIVMSYKLEGKSVKKNSSKFTILGPNDAVEFKDVSKRDKYYDAIRALSKARVINGRPDGTFGADDSVNRVEALKFVLEGVSEDLSSGHSPFDDVENDGWYSPYLYTAYQRGVVSGYEDGTFKPGNEVNKVEFLTMLFKGMDVEVPQEADVAPYEDVPKGEWFTPMVSYAKELGLIEDGQKFYPGEAMTRGEVAYAIHQLMESMK